MEEFTLDAEIQLLTPNGYRFCTNCGTYEHHPLKNCTDCGTEFIRAKHISIRTFIMLTANHGSGPLNTLFCRLFMDTDKSHPYANIS